MLTLLDTCISYVVENIHLVESFESFPDLIGEMIFKAATTEGKFSLLNNSSLHALSLFTSSYNECVLWSVCLESQHLTLANCIHHLLLFTNLRSLNVSSCGIGDEHELLHHISKLPSLLVLALSSNALTDAGIRKMTAPIRIKKCGPLALRCIDLSENTSISASSLKYLRVFQQLLFLDLTATAVKHFQQEAKGFSSMMSLQLLQQFPQLNTLLDLRSQGWAVDTVQHWVHETQQMCRSQSEKSTQRTSSSTKCFYRKKTKPMQEEDNSSSATENHKKRCRGALMLVFVHNEYADWPPALKSQITRFMENPNTIPLQQPSHDVDQHGASAVLQRIKASGQEQLAAHNLKTHEHCGGTEPPAKICRVDGSLRASSLRTCPPVRGQTFDMHETLCDDDTLLLRQYGYTTP